MRRLGAVDVAPLRGLVARLSEQAWDVEDATKENAFPVLSHVRHIVFRFVPESLPLARFYSKPLWNVWRRWLLPVMDEATRTYGFAAPVYPKAMLARLAAGHRIEAHEDRGGLNPLAHKIHVPLETCPRATFTVRGEAFHLQTRPRLRGEQQRGTQRVQRRHPRPHPSHLRGVRGRRDGVAAEAVHTQARWRTRRSSGVTASESSVLVAQ